MPSLGLVFHEKVKAMQIKHYCLWPFPRIAEGSHYVSIYVTNSILTLSCSQHSFTKSGTPCFGESQWRTYLVFRSQFKSFLPLKMPLCACLILSKVGAVW